jgi:predicted small metal-binding protein
MKYLLQGMACDDPPTHRSVLLDIAGASREHGAVHEREARMTQVVHCPCGTDVTGESDDEIVANVQKHVEENHPDQVGKLSREEILQGAHEH